MNRSILIVICDFLLLSLLAFSTPDLDRLRQPADTQHPIQLQMNTNQADSGKDLAAVMRQALNQEQQGHQQLLEELSKARQQASQGQALLARAQAEASQRQALLVEAQRQAGAQQALLAERERLVESFKQALLSKNAEAQRLQQEQDTLQQQYASSQGKLEAMNERLHQENIQNVLSSEKLSAMQDEIKKQTQQAATLQQQLSLLAQSNAVVQTEKDKLTGRLLVAETETRSATEQAARMQGEVQVERKEKAQLLQHADQLAAGVKALASNSGELAKEIRENRPLTPNMIFSDFLSNRVEAAFSASRSGLLGLDSSRQRVTDTILVSDGARTFALCHVQDTPLIFTSPGRDWERLTGTLEFKLFSIPIRSLSFAWPDPRVVLIPITQEEARELGCKVYKITSDPFKFQDAVLVGAREGYYGQCNFQMDLSTPGYIKLDHSFIRGLFGKFNPTRGDLVFSKGGELLGLMVNRAYCRMIHTFDASASLQFGEDVRDEHTGDTLSRLFAQTLGMPAKLQ
jgi:hypothetical protein